MRHIIFGNHQELRHERFLLCRKPHWALDAHHRWHGTDDTAVSLEEPADMEQDVYPLLPALLRKAWERRVSIRMVALKLSHIYGGIFRTELSLDEQSRKRDSERRLASVLDVRSDTYRNRPFAVR